MSEQSKDGGPAFPVNWKVGGYHRMDVDGMTLRDWFAGQALMGVCANPDITASAARCKVSTEDFRRDVANSAYETADAMLAARTAAGGH